jgi:hypothetical protein
MKQKFYHVIRVFCVGTFLVMGCVLGANAFDERVSWSDILIILFCCFVVPMLWNLARSGLEAVFSNFPLRWKRTSLSWERPFLNRLLPYSVVAFGIGYLLHQLTLNEGDAMRGVACIVGGLAYITSWHLCSWLLRILGKTKGRKGKGAKGFRSE